MSTINQNDVVVVGAGIAGMVAGLRAAQGGARVAVLEQRSEDTYICSTRLTGGVFHVALNDIQTDPEKLEAIIVEGRGEGVHRGLAGAIARDTIRAVRWLQRNGVRFVRGSPDPWHTFVIAPPSLGLMGDGWRGRGGDTLLRTLEVALVKAKGAVHRGFRALSLRRCPNGAISLEGETATGGAFAVTAGAAVIADGGFQMNGQLIRGPITPRPDLVVQRNGRTGVGDGLAMALALGATKTEDMSGFYGHVLSRDSLERDDLTLYPWLDELARVGIVVTREGRRFCDEGLGGTYIANRIAALGDPAGTTVIFDQAMWEGPGRNRFLSPNPTLDKVGATVFRAPSLEVLARRADIDPAALIAEVDRYNGMVARGDFSALDPPRTARKFKPWPIVQPPFAAAPAAAGVTYTMGGIRVDEHARVLDATDGPIPGLYAVGASCGGVEGGPKVGYVGGMAKGAVTGLRAAEHIVEHFLPTSGMADVGRIGLIP